MYVLYSYFIHYLVSDVHQPENNCHRLHDKPNESVEPIRVEDMYQNLMSRLCILIIQ